MESKKNADGFFNFQGYLDWIGIDYEKDICCLILTSIRNMGKSTGVWRWIEENIWEKYNHQRKIAFIRTSQTQADDNIKSFEQSFRGKYRVKGNIIQKIVYKTITKKDRETKETIEYEVVDERECFEVGRILDIRNEHNYRSGAGKETFKDYHFAFWDEFNEIDQMDPNLYIKFMNIFSTIRRANSPFLMLIVGNKINANNDIITTLSLDTGGDYDEMYEKLGLDYKPRNTEEDYKQQIIVPGYENVKVWYVDIGTNTFQIVKQEDDIVGMLATFHPRANALYNEGSFLSDKPKNVLNKKLFINKEIQFVVRVKESFFLYSKCGKNKDCICFEMLTEMEALLWIERGVPMIAFDSISFLYENSRKFNDDDSYKQLFKMWINYSRMNKLFYDSFESKLIIDNLISHSIRLYKIDKF